MFEGNLEQRKGFLAIAVPYFTNGYCSAEPEEAAKKGTIPVFMLKINQEAKF